MVGYCQKVWGHAVVAAAFPNPPRVELRVELRAAFNPGGSVVDGMVRWDGRSSPVPPQCRRVAPPTVMAAVPPGRPQKQTHKDPFLADFGWETWPNLLEPARDMYYTVYPRTVDTSNLFLFSLSFFFTFFSIFFFFCPCCVVGTLYYIETIQFDYWVQKYPRDFDKH